MKNNIYLKQLESFKYGMNKQLTEVPKEVFLATDYVKLKSGLRRLNNNIQGIIEKLIRGYPYEKHLTREEVRLAVASQNINFLLFQYLKKNKKSNQDSDRLRKQVAEIAKALENGSMVHILPSSIPSFLLPASKNTLNVIFPLLLGLLKGGSVLNFGEATPWKLLYQKIPKKEIQVVGLESYYGIEKDTICIALFNHDHSGLLEAKSFGLIASSLPPHLSVQKLSFVTNKYASLQQFGFPNFNKAIFFIQDRLWMDKASKLLEQQDGIAVFAISPDGIPSYTFAQIPIISKPGAFIFARKLANQMKGKREVWLINVHINYFEHIQSKLKTPLTVKLEPPAVVPTDTLTKHDFWINEQRLIYEDYVNKNRGKYLPDLLKACYIKDSRIPSLKKI
ncbi:MAG TPA: hypothetical protein ACFCUD_08585 [Cyclobacteriaceae bacterium]